MQCNLCDRGPPAEDVHVPRFERYLDGRETLDVDDVISHAGLADAAALHPGPLSIYTPQRFT